MTIVQQIHNDIDNSIEQLLSAIQQDIEIEQIKPDSIDKDNFIKLVNDYRLYYPQNVFITEKQVKDICQKYDLALGDMFAFESSIPEKNKQEIDNFKLVEKHNHLGNLNISSIDWVNAKGQHMPKDDYRSVADFIIQECISQSTITAFSMNQDGDYEVELPNFRLDRFTETTVFYLNENMGILISRNNKYGKSKFGSCASNVESVNKQIERDFYDYGDLKLPMKEGKYICKLLIQLPKYDNDITLAIALPSNIIQHFSQEHDISFLNFDSILQLSLGPSASLKIDFNLFSRIFFSIVKYIGRSRISSVVDQKVIAPSHMFSNCVFQNGYKMRFDLTRYRNRWIDIDDPIVLQPVKGGYLVVTKWGDESQLINNSSSN